MNRIEFLDLLPEKGIGLELGVAKGDYSKAICDNSKLSKIYGIDKYSDHHDDEEMINMLDLLKDHISSKRYTFLRGTFENYLEVFEDQSLDFIYIDGYAHNGQENGKTLSDWFCKLKPDGIFSGHDYHKKWPRTVNAVNEFVDKNNLKLNIVEDLEVDWDFPSWYVINDRAT